MEIGSIFEIDPLDIHRGGSITNGPRLPIEQGRNFETSFFNTGRSAIEALMKRLKAAGYGKLYLPAFLCDSVCGAAKRAGMSLQYYGVHADLSVDFSAIHTEQNAIIYVVQFFGQKIEPAFLTFLQNAQKAGMIVVEDISLSLLSEDASCVGFGDYIIGSLRKWFPIPDGGILLSKEPMAFDFADAANDYTLNYFTAQILKHQYLADGGEDKALKETFLSYNRLGMEALFSDYTIRRMSRVSEDLLKCQNLEQIKKQRIRNYDLLRDLLSGVPQVKVLVDRQGAMTPLGMVILVEDREELLRHLISKGIYCNVHWRENEAMEHFPDAQYIAARCITIPCDQRYGEKEMHYISETVRAYYGGK